MAPLTPPPRSMQTGLSLQIKRARFLRTALCLQATSQLRPLRKIPVILIVKMSDRNDSQSSVLCGTCGLAFTLPEDEVDGNLPHLLLCGHVFCTACLRALEFEGIIMCPECKVRFIHLSTLTKRPSHLRACPSPAYTYQTPITPESLSLTCPHLPNAQPVPHLPTLTKCPSHLRACPSPAYTYQTTITPESLSLTCLQLTNAQPVPHLPTLTKHPSHLRACPSPAYTYQTPITPESQSLSPWGLCVESCLSEDGVEGLQVDSRIIGLIYTAKMNLRRNTDQPKPSHTPNPHTPQTSLPNPHTTQTSLPNPHTPQTSLPNPHTPHFVETVAVIGPGVVNPGPPPSPQRKSQNRYPYDTPDTDAENGLEEALWQAAENLSQLESIHQTLVDGIQVQVKKEKNRLLKELDEVMDIASSLLHRRRGALLSELSDLEQFFLASRQTLEQVQERKTVLSTAMQQAKQVQQHPSLGSYCELDKVLETLQAPVEVQSYDLGCLSQGCGLSCTLRKEELVQSLKTCLKFTIGNPLSLTGEEPGVAGPPQQATEWKTWRSSVSPQDRRARKHTPSAATEWKQASPGVRPAAQASSCTFQDSPNVIIEEIVEEGEPEHQRNLPNQEAALPGCVTMILCSRTSIRSAQSGGSPAWLCHNDSVFKNVRLGRWLVDDFPFCVRVPIPLPAGEPQALRQAMAPSESHPAPSSITPQKVSARRLSPSLTVWCNGKLPLSLPSRHANTVSVVASWGRMVDRDHVRALIVPNVRPPLPEGKATIGRLKRRNKRSTIECPPIRQGKVFHEWVLVTHVVNPSHFYIRRVAENRAGVMLSKKISALCSGERGLFTASDTVETGALLFVRWKEAMWSRATVMEVFQCGLEEPVSQSPVTELSKLRVFYKDYGISKDICPAPDEGVSVVLVLCQYSLSLVSEVVSVVLVLEGVSVVLVLCQYSLSLVSEVVSVVLVLEGVSVVLVLCQYSLSLVSEVVSVVLVLCQYSLSGHEGGSVLDGLNQCVRRVDLALQAEMSRWPAQAIRCSLKDIVPADLVKGWSTESRVEFQQAVGSKVVEMQVFGEEGDALLVDLKNAPMDKSASDMPLSLRDYLVFLELAIPVLPGATPYPLHGPDWSLAPKWNNCAEFWGFYSPMTKPLSSGRRPLQFYPPVYPRAMVELNAVVCHISTPADFYIQLWRMAWKAGRDSVVPNHLVPDRHITMVQCPRMLVSSVQWKEATTLHGCSHAVDNMEFLLLNAKLQELYSQDSQQGGLEVFCPMLEQACAALFEDKVWYRAQIIGEGVTKGIFVLLRGCVGSGLTLGGVRLVEVRYVDFGNKMTIPMSDIRKLKDEFFTLPAMVRGHWEVTYAATRRTTPLRGLAIQCCLADLTPTLSSDSWSEECTKRFRNLAEQKLMSAMATEVVPQQQALPVRLYEVREDSEGGGQTDIAQLLVDEELACFRKGVKEKASEADMAVWDPPFEGQGEQEQEGEATSPEEGSLTDDAQDPQPHLQLPRKLKDMRVRVTHVCSPASFYVQLLQMDSQLKRVYRKLKELYVRSEPQEVEWGADMHCAAYINGVWERGKICSVSSANIAEVTQPASQCLEVLRCDFGNKVKVHVSNLRTLQPQLIGSMVLECSLSDIRPAGGRSTWTATACDFISYYMTGAMAIITIKENTPYRPIPVVLYCSNRAGKDVSIADFLVSEGLALKERRRPLSGQFSLDAAADVGVWFRPVPAEGAEGDALPKRNEGAEREGPSSLPCPDPAAILPPALPHPKPPPPHMNIPPEAVRTRPYIPPDLPHCGLNKMTVTAIGEDGVIYAMTQHAEREGGVSVCVRERDVEKRERAVTSCVQKRQWEQLKDELQQHIKTLPRLKPYSWRSVLGCAVMGSDMLWYRGEVLEVIGGHVKVRYVDQGLVENIPVCHVYPMVLCADIPQLCIPCRLHGIIPGGREKPSRIIPSLWRWSATFGRVRNTVTQVCMAVSLPNTGVHGGVTAIAPPLVGRVTQVCMAVSLPVTQVCTGRESNTGVHGSVAAVAPPLVGRVTQVCMAVSLPVTQVCMMVSLQVGQKWQQDAVALLRELLHTRCVDLQIVELPSDPRGHVTVQVWLDNMPLSRIMVHHQHATFDPEVSQEEHMVMASATELDDWELDTKGLEDPKPMLGVYTYPRLPDRGEHFRVKIKHLRTPNEVFLYPVVEDRSEELEEGETLEEALDSLNSCVESLPLLTDFPIGTEERHLLAWKGPCLAEYSDGKYYRAKLLRFEGLNPVKLLVRHVDFGSDDTVPTQRGNDSDSDRVIVMAWSRIDRVIVTDDGDRVIVMAWSRSDRVIVTDDSDRVIVMAWSRSDRVIVTDDSDRVIVMAWSRSDRVIVTDDSDRVIVMAWSRIDRVIVTDDSDRVIVMAWSRSDRVIVTDDSDRVIVMAWSRSDRVIVTDDSDRVIVMAWSRSDRVIVTDDSDRVIVMAWSRSDRVIVTDDSDRVIVMAWSRSDRVIVTDDSDRVIVMAWSRIDRVIVTDDSDRVIVMAWSRIDRVIVTDDSDRVIVMAWSRSDRVIVTDDSDRVIVMAWSRSDRVIVTDDSDRVIVMAWSRSDRVMVTDDGDRVIVMAWSRSDRVIVTDDSDRVIVMAWSRSDRVIVTELRHIPATLLRFPCKAIKVRVAGFKPPHVSLEKERVSYSPEWSMKAALEMIDLLHANITASVVVRSTVPETAVFLYDEKGALVHLPLVEKGLADLE
ncbi:hypothetical protein JZ751_025522 [Albula glossodonta]|uniref:RING-type domain-containing protein n=1 Tax=Albula glossodonta TaxID=121402 RepID=A0A8T2MWL1_9TELE|nr:hypothetical protein JZ751_025522 [Albula glossodonta]